MTPVAASAAVVACRRSRGGTRTRSRRRIWRPTSGSSNTRAWSNPQSADLRTCLGMAHAVNYDVYKSMDALEDARAVDPDNFWAQLKYAELHYRLRALDTAEEETRRALELADDAAAARRWPASSCRRSGR